MAVTWQRLLEDMPDGIFVLSAEGVVRYANQASGELFRRSRTELVGHPFGFPIAAGEWTELDIPLAAGDWSSAEMRVAETEWEGAPAYVAVLRDLSRRRRTEAGLREEAELLAALVGSSPLALVALAGDRSVRFWSRAAERLFGWCSQEVLGRPCPLVPPEGLSEFERLVDEVLAGATVLDREVRHLAKSGELLEVGFSAVPLRGSRGRMAGALCLFADIGERKRAQEQMLLAAEVFENTQEGIVVADRDARIVSVNPAFSAVTGYRAEEVVGRNPSLLQSGRHGADFYQAMWAELQERGRWQGEIWNRRKSGEVFPEWLNISAIRDGGEIVHYVAVFSDITLVKQNEERLHRLAHFDALTGLPNRLLFADRLEQALTQAYRRGGLVGLLFLDLDRFKAINDSLGHRAGDLLLQEAARRIGGVVRAQDTVCRLGGDEFTVILPDLLAPAGAANVADKIIAALSAPYQLVGREVYVTTSVGIAIHPITGDSPESLLKHADIAMYQAKQEGRNSFRFYRHDGEGRAQDVFELEAGLRHALARQELSLVYLPQMEIETGRVIAVEALLRWQHPARGEVPPDEFIPVAEDSGLIGPIGEWVLRQACAQNRAWQAAGLPPVRVAVNVSVRQLRHPRFAEKVVEILEDTGLEPEWLEIELTERVFVQYARETAGILWQLKSVGVHFSVDDFGTGYSSVNYLKRFPVDAIKIDRSFVGGIARNRDDQAISDAIIALGNSLKLRVVAEGVETEEQLWFLRQHHCCDAQGFLLSAPLSGGELADLLASSRQRH